nr:MAG TPA: hypothetical protein [Caudoviricetes sp.]
MNIKYSLDTTGYRFYPFTTDQVQKCKPGKTYVLDTDNIQIIPEDIRRCIMNDATTTSRAWDKSSVLACKKFLNSLYGSGAFDVDVASRSPIDIVDVIFHDPATIVFWSDGTKTVVKCQPGDKFDPEKGLAMAIVKKTMGNTGSYCNIFKKWIKEVKSDGEV